MKQYIKPQTEVQTIQMNVYMQTVSDDPISTANDKMGNGQQMTKERDVWSDGFWN